MTHEEELQRYHSDMLGLILALDQMVDVYWGPGDGQLPEPQCIQRARAALAKARGGPVGDTESEFDDMAYRFSCVLDHATGGRMSKTNYTKEAMYAEIDDHITRCVDDLRDDFIDECLDVQPSTAENPNEDSYQRGRFDGIMEFSREILALKSSAPAEMASSAVSSHVPGGENV